MDSDKKISCRKASSIDLLDTMKDLDRPEVQKQHGQNLDSVEQDPVIMAAVQINSSDDEESKGEPGQLSVISEKVGEESSWAGQSKIKQFIAGGGGFDASISWPDASRPKGV